MRFDRHGFTVAFGLSALLLAPAVDAAAAAIALRGKVSGPVTVTQANPDTGKHYALGGSGTVAPLGACTVNGSFNTPGNIANGHAEGTVTLTAAQGSVTLQLVGPPSPAFGPPPASFNYTITGGTGSFAGASGTGKAAFLLNDPTLAPGKGPGHTPNYSLDFGGAPYPST
jgi:hypothetical protein